MKKTIKLMTNFIMNNIGVVNDQMVIVLGAPYSEKSVKIVVNPNLSYKNNEGKEYLEVKYTANTKKLTFNLTNNSSKKITLAGVNYKITLVEIGKFQKQKNQRDSFFKFLIERD